MLEMVGRVSEAVVMYDDMSEVLVEKSVRWRAKRGSAGKGGQPSVYLVLEGGNLEMTFVPKDGITWSEGGKLAKDLNKKLSRDLSGVLERSVKAAKTALGDVEEL